MLVHISPERSRGDMSVSVYYRNNWFYICNSDYKSKRTFAMRKQILNLQAGETPRQSVPVLTIPAR